MAVGAAFNTAWNSLGPDQQQIIRAQAKLMKKKGFKARPHMVNYYGAIAAAVTIENADPSKLGGFFSVADKVLAENNPVQANLYFQLSRDFFEQHALNYEKAFKLIAKDDNYNFKYLEPPPPDRKSVV